MILQSSTSSNNYNDSNKTEKKLKRSSFDASKKRNQQHRIFIECHRGVHKEEPENTLAAFEKAILLECDSIEMDIWLSKDKVPVVVHGDKEGKINQASEKINQYDYFEISKIKLENNHIIPKLEDVFQLCKNKIFLNLEIKDTNHKLAFDEVYKLIVDFNMHNQVAISSFYHDYYQEIKIKNLDSQIEFGFLYDIAELRINEINFEFMNSTLNFYFREINEELVKKAHGNNIGVLAYFYMNDDEKEEEIIHLINCKVDIICTNDPRKIFNILKNLKNISF